MNKHEEHDILRDMLYTSSRKGFKNSIVTGKNSVNESENGEITLDQTIKAEEERKFRDIISPKVEFNDFIVYPESNNAEWSGKFYDNKIEWFFSLGEPNGVYISCELAKLNEETLEIMKKLGGYYDVWSAEWANKVATEYKNNIDGQNF